MSTARYVFKQSATFAAIALLVVVLLPVLVVLAFSLRALLLIPALLVLVGLAAAYLLSPALRARLDAMVEPQVSYSGLRLATDVAVHPAHGWVRFGNGEATVGADDLMQSVIGPVDSVELPAPGTTVAQGARLLRLRRGERTVDVQAPVSGVVVSRNELLAREPQRVNRDPFGEGWVVRLRADRDKHERRTLLRGEGARKWFRSEVDRLFGVLGAHYPHAAEPTLADGGVIVSDFYRHIDDDAWKEVVSTLFDQKESRS
ncbi:MAG: hypothetical protein OEQ13_06840 [Acidobacteriota bacterium]|nr:hypothetical protein [Acidobacteriota bacterium]